MKKIVIYALISTGILISSVGCSQKALPQAREGTISESYSGIIKRVEPVSIKGDGAWTSFLGTILGGVVGYQFGDGAGRDLATMGGTMAGSIAGADADVREAQRITIEFDSGKVITTVLAINSNNPVKFKGGERVTVFITNGKVTEIR